jgi:hypothetical protein
MSQEGQQQKAGSSSQQQNEGPLAMFCCFSGGPMDEDPRAGNSNMFKTTMLNAPCADPLCCLAGCVCCPCTQYVLRQKALDNDMSRYVCCQGFMNTCGFEAGSCGEKSCPEVCLCCESCCCLGCAASATRAVLMTQKGLMSDPCDLRIIRFTNCLMFFSCICTIVSALTGVCEDAAAIVGLIAEIVFYTTLGCMSAQINFEITTDGTGGTTSGGTGAPGKQQMV